MPSSKPPKIHLNPLAKSLFLRHRGFGIYKKEGKNFTSCENKTSMSRSFLKAILISKSYLFASQRNKTYELSLQKSWDDTNIEIRFSSTQAPYWFLNNIQTSCENLCQLNQLLKFPYTVIDFDPDMETANMFKELLKNHLTQARLSLSFSDLHSLFAPSFLQLFSNRIYDLNCEPDFLIDAPPMNLEYCGMSLKSLDQAKSILTRHSIKSCIFECSKSQDWPIDFIDFPICTRLEKLNICNYMWQIQPTNHFENFLKILDYFPNLKALKIDIIEPEYFNRDEKDLTISNNAVNIAINALKQIQLFHETCSLSLNVKIECKFGGTVRETKEQIQISMKRLKDLEIFKKFIFVDRKISKNEYTTFYAGWRQENFFIRLDFEIINTMEEEDQ